MRQLPADKYNVAWFKLAEFVVRGEKERALGLYRLLVHSFDDAALAYQLEGDLLLSFHDGAAAKEKYTWAAQKYAQEHRFIEAAAVYEHLISLAPDYQDYYEQLLLLYTKLKYDARLLVVLKQVSEFLIKKTRHEDCMSILAQYEVSLNPQQQAEIYGFLTLLLVEHKSEPATIELYLEKTAELLLASDDAQQIPAFLMKLDALNTKYYQKVVHYLKD